MLRLILAILLLMGQQAAPAFAQATPPKQANVGGCAVTTSSTQCLGAIFRWELTVENVSASATVGCAFNAVAVIYGSATFLLRPGQRKTWSYTSGTAPPGGPLNCIGDAAGTVRAEYI